MYFTVPSKSVIFSMPNGRNSTAMSTRLRSDIRLMVEADGFMDVSWFQTR